MKRNLISRSIAVLLICCFATDWTFAEAQKRIITGLVTDASDGTSIPFASIKIANTTKGTTSDEYGNYRIEVPSDSVTLVFSFLGYEPQQVKVGKQTFINVQLSPQNELLESIVVIGHGTVSRDIVTGSVSSVTTTPANRKAKQAAKIQEDLLLSRTYVQSAEQTLSATNQMDHFVHQEMISSAPAQNNEEYGEFVENKFLPVTEQALSTFSIDVDAASYSNVRRFINNGQTPPKDAVRTEELVNYFDYNYPQPVGQHPINGIVEIGPCPWNNAHRLVHVGIKAKEIAKDNLPASNLVFLIDVSGSMDEPNRLPLVKTSLKMLVKQLRDKDRVAIVVYAGAAGEVLPSTSGAEKNKIIDALDRLTAGGSTAGGAGIRLAYKIAKQNFAKDGNNRVILASDGDFNVGVSSNKELEKLIEEERKSGVFLTILGYGMGNYKDSKMQVLAQKGNGNHAYIDNATEAEKVLVKEFGGTLFTIAKDVKVQVEFNPAKVQAYRLIGYETRLLNKEDFNDDTKDAGEMGAGHTVTALYEVIPTGVQSNLVASVDKLKYQTVPAAKETNGITSSNESLTLKIRYKEPDGDVSKKMEIPVVDKNTGLAVTSDNFRFSAAVAQVGMLLHDSPYKGSATYKEVIKQAQAAYGNDAEGYRHEFVKLVKSLDLISDNRTTAQN